MNTSHHDADPIAGFIQRAAALRFAVPEPAAGAPVGAVYGAMLAAEALGDTGRVRQAIARAWQPLAQMGKPAMLWDLAVREAKTWALEGRLDEALAGLEAWRGSAALAGPGEFEMRAAGVCLGGCDFERARQLWQQACAAAPGQSLWRLDEALFEARLGSAQRAREGLLALGDGAKTPALKPVLDFILGILACREQDPAALGLLTPAATDFLAKSETGSAAWAMLSIGGGWLALALGQAGRRDDALALIDALRPILLQVHNASLLMSLKDAGLLPAGLAVPAWPLPAPPDAAERASGPAPAEHGSFRTVSARGVNALALVQACRREFAQGRGPYAFLVGDEEDLSRLLDSLTPPVDGGHAALEQARTLDAAAWLAQHGRKAKPRWPADGPPPVQTVLSQFDAVSQQLKPLMLVGLVDLQHPSELFARIGYGGWNDCPPSHVHTALHRHWHERFGAEPVAVCNDVVECLVDRPPQDRPDALALAREHQAYCDDVVEQGVGSAGKLASSLLKAEVWYFWWD